MLGLLIFGLGGCEAVDKYLARKEHAEAKAEQTKAREQAEAEGKEYRRSGPDFSVPVPEGYTEIVDDKVLASMGAGGFGFAADARGGEGWFLASIAFAPTAAGSPEVADAATCKEAATGLASMTNTKVLRDGMVEIGGAQRCQWELTANDDADRRARGTAMRSPTQTWVVTCNYDARDESAQATCSEVLEGWKNET
jgi:hypothetical protein